MNALIALGGVVVGGAVGFVAGATIADGGYLSFGPLVGALIGTAVGSAVGAVAAVAVFAS